MLHHSRSFSSALVGSRAPSFARAARLALLFGACALAVVSEAQTVPGFQVATYANVTDPALLAFGPTVRCTSDVIPSPPARRRRSS